MPNPPLWLKLVMTALLSVTAVVLYLLNKKSKTRFNCMIAMLLCTVGDVFMTNSLKINDMVSTIIGASSFIAGHIFYSLIFIDLLMKDNKKLTNTGFIVGLVVGLLPIIVMDILGFTIVSEPEVLYLVAVPFYVFVITFHIATNFAYGWENKSWRTLVLAVAVVLFYVTDIWIFLYMFKLAPKALQDCVWYFYPLAQLAIILCVELPKKASK